MKIDLFGNKNLVTSASAEHVPAGLVMTINCRQKGLPFHRAGSSMAFISQSRGDTEQSPHDCVVITDSDDENDFCEVVFIAENDMETGLLNGNAFEQTNKDQIVILKLRKELKLESTISSLGHINNFQSAINKTTRRP